MARRPRVAGHGRADHKGRSKAKAFWNDVGRDGAGADWAYGAGIACVPCSQSGKSVLDWIFTQYGTSLPYPGHSFSIGKCPNRQVDFDARSKTILFGRYLAG